MRKSRVSDKILLFTDVKDCDIIIVLDEGKIVDMGKHDHLLENCIEYKEISDSQMGGAFVE